jgi:HAD superfamily hydrolase (TIGR01490 family)
VKLTLFDLDGTLLAIDSDHAFGEYLVGLGWADGDTFRRRNDEFYAQYLAEKLDIDAYVDFATAPWRDRPADALAAAQQGFLREVVEPALHPAALALVRRHQDDGDLVAIVTATNDVVTRPIADRLGVPHLIATELERDARGRVTGAIRGTPAFRDGKVARVAQWLRERGESFAAFERTTFYSDSVNDLPLLDHVGHPVATNPGTALLRVARERGWPVLELFA